MNKFLSILSILFFTIICNAQHHSVYDFIPKGYVEYEKYFGDLNKDGQDDCVLIIKKTDKNNVVTNQFGEKVDRNRRGIIILFKKDETYQLADKNYHCFSSENEDGGGYYAPQLSITIKNNDLYVSYDYGRYGNWEYTFRFQHSNFELIHYEIFYKTDTDCDVDWYIYDDVSINFLTQEKLTNKFVKINADGEEIYKKISENISVNKLLKLSKIKDFSELNIDEIK